MNSDVRCFDPMEEVYAIRRKMSAQYGHDVRRLAEAAKEWMRRDQAEGRVYVRLPIVRRTPSVV